MTSRRITPLTEPERATHYPYDAPMDSFVISGDSYAIKSDTDLWDLRDRIAVLSVGSNRSPQQLLRKFGDDSYLPVTRALLKDCDVIHSACFSYYGAVPCSAYPCKGTDIMLNAVWLTKDQLQIMHDTEAVGIAYDYAVWQDRSVEIKDAVQPDAVYGYATRLGYFPDQEGKPFALSSLAAENRQYSPLSQAQARTHLCAKLPEALRIDDDAKFLQRIVADKPYRLAVNAALAEMALPVPHGPWQIIPATPLDADRFL